MNEVMKSLIPVNGQIVNINSLIKGENYSDILFIIKKEYSGESNRIATSNDFIMSPGAISFSYPDPSVDTMFKEILNRMHLLSKKVDKRE